MKFSLRVLYASALSLFLLSSCAKMEDPKSNTIYETMALKAWMELHRPDLVENKQTIGEYYVDVLDPGHAEAAPINDTACWVQFDFSGRDLSGNIILSRSEEEARQSATFTKYTHYVPYYRYCGGTNINLLEGTYLAMRNKLTLGQAYYDKYKVERQFPSQEILLREGAKVVLYMPSSVVGSGVEADGGYEGQYTLDAGRPFIVTMEIRDTTKNPVKTEGGAVDAFCKQDGGLVVFDNKDNKRPKDVNDPKHPYNMPEHWSNAVDSVAQLYVNYRYSPDQQLSFPAEMRYKSNYAPYSNLDDLNLKISQALEKRFHKDKAYVGVKALKDSVKMDGTANIWYIGRFLDGFIFDTNIPEIKRLVYDEGWSGSAISYKPESGGLISAWYYSVPNLKFGQWAAFITTSTNAYGSSGSSGSTSTSTSNNYNYSDYYSYYNNYYGGNGYYGGYYGDYYNNYNGGYYGGYDSGYTGNTGTTTTSVKTEILPYTPIMFQVYIEPKAEE